jgi:hypothetical protein
MHALVGYTVLVPMLNSELVVPIGGREWVMAGRRRLLLFCCLFLELVTNGQRSEVWFEGEREKGGSYV